MSPVSQKVLLSLLLCGAAASSHVLAQMVPPPAPAKGPRVEPGLEAAVKWKWRVEASDPKLWGLELPVKIMPAQPPTTLPGVPPGSVPTAPAAPMAAPGEGDVYVIKRGDRLILIAKKYGMTVTQLKAFNGLATDMIRVGDQLKIPSAEELKSIPIPVATPPPEKKKGKGGAPVAPKVPDQRWKPGSEMDNLALQVYLDRAGFSVGPIDAKSGVTFARVMQVYQDSHPETPDADSLRQKVQLTTGDPFTHYTLKDEDFRFIATPKAERYNASATPTPTPKPSTHKSKSAKAPLPVLERAWNYEELTGSTMLAYRSPWQFVAERFHCDETYLRMINDKLKDRPAAGTVFKVPDVVPFEIESALNEPLQPPVNPQSPTKAVVQDMALLQVMQGDKIVAVMPISSARPGLKGKGTWTIMGAIPRPRLATKQELVTPPPKNQRLFGVGDPSATPPPEKPILTTEQILPAGPKNPVGIIWIDLAKAGSTDPLPYGLHGTSIPDKMSTQESLGGFRLTNWDIARAVRLLPVGTPLEWQQRAAAAAPAAGAVAPAALPAMPASVVPTAPSVTSPTPAH